jgi:glycosyltransferase involved in cell wall biosynthesis
VGGGIVIGVAAGELDAVERSCEYVRLHTDPSAELLRLSSTGALAFDELIEHTAGLVVLLEAGALVGPRWLQLLTTAMHRTGAGLAGPSTNRAWNEQASVHALGSDLRGIRRDSATALRRFGHAVRTLRPLYSLGDFCYAVRRDVIDAVGPADPAYQDGPCWEMDYNIRAARAGFDGIWVGASYVWRPPAAEATDDLLPRNRELYQDRFCGLRLRGETDTYQPHCRGEDCPDFAPRELITIRLGQPPSVTTLAPQARALTIRPAEPLVSCIMPTRNRPQLAAQAVRYFLTQNYPNAELVIVDDSSELASRLASDPRIRVIPPATRSTRRRRHSIGGLRNAGCAAARGELIVLWDDDDWHGPTRIGDQVAPLVAATADITALTDLDWFEPATWRSWRLSPQLHRSMLRRDVYGGTIAFRRSLWQRHRFPDRSLAEDADFLDNAVRGGARLQRLSGQGRYVYVRHATNSWQVHPGTPTAPDGWLAVPIPNLPAADLDFYAALRRHGPPEPVSPLVSCIMPTRDRRAYVAKACEYFLRQDYLGKELIILDDGEDSIEDAVPAQAGIRYQRLDRRLVLGAKRNLACELAHGELIAHWDDDDWQAPNRLSIQVSRLTGGGADLCGSSSLLFWEPRVNRAWRYTWPGGRSWAAGTSLCYPRSLWARSPFSEVAVGEDTRFVWQAHVRRISDVRAENCVVGLVHPGNTVAKNGRGAYWKPVGINEVASCLGNDMMFYQDLWRTPTISVGTG